MFGSLSIYSKKRRQKYAFSLIELLVVMAVAAALLAIAVPSLSRSSSDQLRSSRELVKSQLQQARFHAISKGSPTAVVVPSSPSGRASAPGSIAIIEVELENGNYIAAQDRLASRLSKLPGNTRFAAASEIGSDKATLLDGEETLQINHRGTLRDYHFIVFGSHGQILSPAPGTAVHIAITTKRGTGEAGAFDLIHVNRLTGVARSVQP